ncbi:hypothetical protein KBD33_02245 [Candidatus Gracilibacteria bacterium]|nr:hypothetical protein [Candidatus Gracilibacteria bacterium]
MKFFTLLLIPLLFFMTGCSIGGNEKEPTTQKIKCELNNDWNELNGCYESVDYCDQNNICASPMLPIACGKDFSQHLDLKCECKIENGITYSRIACK